MRRAVEGGAPGSVKVWLQGAPDSSMGEPQAPSFAVTVWARGASLVQTMVVPGGTSIRAGA